jgi:ribosomal protein L37AE/L43A
MGLDQLPTLATMQAQRRAVAKADLPTRLDAKTAADRSDAKALQQWAHAVRARDRETCRVCQRKTVRTVALDPRRGEAHHLRPRSCLVTRTDVRNGVWTCLACHKLLTGHKLFPVGQGADSTFKAGRTGKTFLNGDSLTLTFVSKRPDP